MHTIWIFCAKCSFAVFFFGQQGRLNELLSQIRMRQSAFTPAERMTERYNIEPNVLEDLKQVIKRI